MFKKKRKIDFIFYMYKSDFSDKRIDKLYLKMIVFSNVIVGVNFCSKRAIVVNIFVYNLALAVIAF